MVFGLVILGVAAVAMAAAAVAAILAKAGDDADENFCGAPVGSTTTTCIKVEDATKEQGETVVKAHIRAREMIDNAISRLERARTNPDPLVNEYFGISGTGDSDQEFLDALINKYRKMQDGMEDIGYEVEHEEIKPGEPYTVAYVRTVPMVGGVGDVHICFPAFDKGSDDDRAATVVHEMSHYVAGTVDHAYDWETEKWNGMSTNERLDNADSLGGFARDS